MVGRAFVLICARSFEQIHLTHKRFIAPGLVEFRFPSKGFEFVFHPRLGFLKVTSPVPAFCSLRSCFCKNLLWFHGETIRLCPRHEKTDDKNKN